MKQEAIQKINKLGKAGQIIANICKALVMVGIVCLIIGAIAIAVLPKDLMAVTVNSDVIMHMNTESLGVLMKEEDQDEIVKSLEEEFSKKNDVKVNGADATLEKVEVTDKNIDLYMTTGDMKYSGMRNMAIMLGAMALFLTSLYVTFVFIGKLSKEFHECETPFTESIIKKMHRLAISLIPTCILGGIAQGMAEGFMTGDFTFNIDLGVVLAVLVVLVLTNVFKYGAMLQQESDETL